MATSESSAFQCQTAGYSRRPHSSHQTTNSRCASRSSGAEPCRTSLRSNHTSHIERVRNGARAGEVGACGWGGPVADAADAVLTAAADAGSWSGPAADAANRGLAAPSSDSRGPTAKVARRLEVVRRRRTIRRFEPVHHVGPFVSDRPGDNADYKCRMGSPLGRR